MNLTRRHLIIGASAVLGLNTTGLAAPLAASRDDDAAITALFNQLRREHGLPPVAMHKNLRQMALFQAERMAKHGKLKHSVGFGYGFRSRLHKARIHAKAAENIASGQRDYKQVFAAWMRSPGHRRNMLDPAFAYYGLASATSSKRPGYPYWALVLSL